MRSTAVLLIVAVLTMLAAIVIVALWRHKKAAAGDIKLIGEIATVEAPLTPEGTVIVGGELWPARSHDGRVILSQARVRVVGFKDFFVLVEACD